MGMGTGPGVRNAFNDMISQLAIQNSNAPIPRAGGQAPTSSPPGFGSEWTQLNGQLVGDTYLPPGTSTVDVGKGWYEVHHGGNRVGTLRPGGDNGRFINDTNWQIPTPGLPSAPLPAGGGAGGGMAQPSPAFNASGPYGRQAMQMAGLLGQPQVQGTAPAAGGLLGGPTRGFRIPGGK